MLQLAGGSAEKIYRGSLTVAGQTSTVVQTDIDITSLGLTDLNKFVEKLKGQTSNGAQTDARIVATSLTNLRAFTLAPTGWSVFLEWEIEVNPGFVSVQRVTTTLTSDSNYMANNTETITSVGDTLKAEVYNNGVTATQAALQSKAYLASLTTMPVHASCQGAGLSMTCSNVVVKRRS